MDYNRNNAFRFKQCGESSTLFYLGFVLVCISVGVLGPSSPFIAISLTVLIFASIYYINKPIKVLIVLMLISPFAGTIYLRDNYVDIPGFKPVLILGCILAFIAAINKQQSLHMPKYGRYFCVILFALFTISVIRSVKYLDIFNRYYYIEDNLTTARYMLSAYFKPLVFFIPIIVVIKYVKTQDDIDKIMDGIFFTLIILSVHLLYTYAKCYHDSMDFDAISQYYSKTYNMHRNNLAAFYVIGFPIVMRRYFVSKKASDIIAIFIILTSVGLLLSRTGYGAVMFGMLMYLFISKRRRYLPLVLISIVCLLIIGPRGILKRAETGLKEKDPQAISAGRIDDIWVPLVKEYLDDKGKFVFGNGRYSIQASNSAAKGNVLKVIEPHNMYLELFIDAGIVGLLSVLTLYYIVMRNAFYALKHNSNANSKESYYACIVSISCYLISGLTGNTFFPSNENILLWVVLGCSISLFGLAFSSLPPKNEIYT